VDFVDIITPPATHHELCAEAARRKIATICQKPLAPSYQEAVRLVEMMEQTEARTAGHTRMTLQIAFNYGGRAELVDVARRIAADAVAGRLRPDRVSAKSIQARLYEPEAPDVDLLIRTSGEQRLSNFLLWEAAYAELVFTPVLWPDFDRSDLFAAIAEYQRRQRRFGAV
jgi:undecaprenyl diphosphate synthase